MVSCYQKAVISTVCTLYPKCEVVSTKLARLVNYLTMVGREVFLVDIDLPAGKHPLTGGLSSLQKWHKRHLQVCMALVSFPVTHVLHKLNMYRRKWEEKLKCYTFYQSTTMHTVFLWYMSTHGHLTYSWAFCNICNSCFTWNTNGCFYTSRSWMKYIGNARKNERMIMSWHHTGSISALT